MPIASGLLLLAIFAGIWALRGWLRMSTGSLRWDGEQLHWQKFQTPVQSLHLLLDMDFLLFLRLNTSGGQSDYLVLTRAADQNWNAIRRVLVAFEARPAGARPE